MKTILTVVAVAILAMGFTGCSDKQEKKHSQQAQWIAKKNDTEAARQALHKSMDSDLLPEGGGKKMPMF